MESSDLFAGRKRPGISYQAPSGSDGPFTECHPGLLPRMPGGLVEIAPWNDRSSLHGFACCGSSLLCCRYVFPKKIKTFHKGKICAAGRFFANLYNVLIAGSYRLFGGCLHSDVYPVSCPCPKTRQKQAYFVELLFNFNKL